MRITEDTVAGAFAYLVGAAMFLVAALFGLHQRRGTIERVQKRLERFEQIQNPNLLQRMERSRLRFQARRLPLDSTIGIIAAFVIAIASVVIAVLTLLGLIPFVE